MHRLASLTLALGTLGLVAPALAQPASATADSSSPVAAPSLTDATAGRPLPDFIPPNKRMSDADLEKKKTGMFVTALPAFSSDPLNGLGGVFDGFVYVNGDRTDRLFAYTPYQAKLGMHAQYTTNHTSRLQLSLDTPYLYESPWRMKLDLKYKNDPNRAFFGLTEDTLAPLAGGTYAAYNQSLKSIRPGTRPGEAGEVTDTYYNQFKEREYMINAKFDRAVLDGNTRLMMGYELQHLSFETFDGTPVEARDPATGERRVVPNGQTRLSQGADAGQVVGTQGGLVSILQSALIYDTRDFEPDPTRGLFLEAANEFSAPIIGSQFIFDKVLLQAKSYHRLLPDWLPRTVFATRFGLGTVFGDQAPFFEYHDQWTTEGSIPAVGGGQSNRGYKTNRFLARTVGFANLELRHRFAEVDLLNQNLTFSLVPFLDLGAVGDGPFQLRLDQPRAAVGTGLRVGWNRSTIVVADFAVSGEDQQLFINFNKSY